MTINIIQFILLLYVIANLCLYQLIITVPYDVYSFQHIVSFDEIY